MNKAELASEVSSKVGTTKKETQNVIDAVIETIGDTLSRGEKVTLVGFGTFQVTSRKDFEREGEVRDDSYELDETAG